MSDISTKGFKTFIGTTIDTDWCKNVVDNGDPNPNGMNNEEMDPQQKGSGRVKLISALNKRTKLGTKPCADLVDEFFPELKVN